MDVLECASLRARELALQERVRGSYAVDVQRGLERRNVAGIGQRKRKRDQRRIAGLVTQQIADQRYQRLREHERTSTAVVARQAQECIGERALRSVPAVDRIAVVRGQKRELGVAIVVDKLDRRGKAAQQRRDRWRRNVDESKRLTCLFHVQDTRRRSRRPLARERERQIVAFGIQQADREGNVKGLLVCLTRRGSGLLLDVERVATRRRIVMAARTHHGRARLRVPAAKLHQL